MKIKKSEVVALWNTIEQLGFTDAHIKFTYALAKNKKLIKNEVEAIKESIDPSEKFKEFENRRLDICKDMAKKDKDGKPIIINNTEFDIKNTDKFNSKIEDLKKEYQDDIDKETEKNKQAMEMLEEEIDIDLTQVELDYFPERITTSQMEFLMFLVKE